MILRTAVHPLCGHRGLHKGGGRQTPARYRIRLFLNARSIATGRQRQAFRREPKNRQRNELAAKAVSCASAKRSTRSRRFDTDLLRYAAGWPGGSSLDKEPTTRRVRCLRAGGSCAFETPKGPVVGRRQISTRAANLRPAEGCRALQRTSTVDASCSPPPRRLRGVDSRAFTVEGRNRVSLLAHRPSFSERKE